MSTDQPTVTADAHAEQRLDAEYDVESIHEEGGYLFTLDNEDEEIAVIACAGLDVDAGQLHGSIAAVCHAALAELQHEQEVLE